MSAERRRLSLGDDEHGGKLDREHRPYQPVGDEGGRKPFPIRVRFDDQDRDQRERRREHERLERRADATGFVLLPHS